MHLFSRPAHDTLPAEDMSARGRGWFSSGAQAQGAPSRVRVHRLTFFRLPLFRVFRRLSPRVLRYLVLVGRGRRIFGIERVLVDRDRIDGRALAELLSFPLILLLLGQRGPAARDRLFLPETASSLENGPDDTDGQLDGHQNAKDLIGGRLSLRSRSASLRRNLSHAKSAYEIAACSNPEMAYVANADQALGEVVVSTGQVKDREVDRAKVVVDQRIE